ncbi:hypothetical protein [Pseudomonas migulae]|uniref:SPOR domain-containing protein n=1 Tax=Pseudomonas migulae TaxID=78543 RepID=A0A1H5H8Z8_9PSED|nr:hypothetical protein [Pseudomonas migulae]SEE24429.1 hypothetical protein SAMN04490194_1516 [Pseudomonas migulae]
MSRPYQSLLRILLGAQIIGFVYLVVMGINALSCHPTSPALFSEMVDIVDSGLSRFFLSGEQSLKARLGYESLRALEVKLSLENNMSLVFRLAPLLGLIGLFALFAILRRLLRRRQVKKSKTVCLHIFAKTVKLTPHVFQVCGTCRASVRYPAHESVCSTGVWVIEIALNSSLVRKVTSRAIKELALPVIRREINLIVIGVYRNKAEAAAVIKLLKEKYDVRGWVVQGN